MLLLSIIVYFNIKTVGTNILHQSSVRSFQSFTLNMQRHIIAFNFNNTLSCPEDRKDDGQTLSAYIFYPTCEMDRTMSSFERKNFLLNFT